MDLSLDDYIRQKKQKKQKRVHSVSQVYICPDCSSDSDSDAKKFVETRAKKSKSFNKFETEAETHQNESENDEDGNSMLGISIRNPYLVSESLAEINQIPDFNHDRNHQVTTPDLKNMGMCLINLADWIRNGDGLNSSIKAEENVVFGSSQENVGLGSSQFMQMIPMTQTVVYPSNGFHQAVGASQIISNSVPYSLISAKSGENFSEQQQPDGSYTSVYPIIGLNQQQMVIQTAEEVQSKEVPQNQSNVYQDGMLRINQNLDLSQFNQSHPEKNKDDFDFNSLDTNRFT